LSFFELSPRLLAVRRVTALTNCSLLLSLTRRAVSQLLHGLKESCLLPIAHSGQIIFGIAVADNAAAASAVAIAKNGTVVDITATREVLEVLDHKLES